MSKKYVAGVEGGGTSWKIGLGQMVNGKFVPLENEAYKLTVKTTKPEETLGRINAWLKERQDLFYAVGVACFGPVNLDRNSSKFGYIRSNTPKKAWRDAPVLKLITAGLDPNISVGFDTDVNAPALAEFIQNVEPLGKSSCAYVTVGTGVGVGLVVNGKTVRGLMHPEGGHISVPLIYVPQAETTTTVTTVTTTSDGGKTTTTTTTTTTANGQTGGNASNDRQYANEHSIEYPTWNAVECFTAKASIERRVKAQPETYQKILEKLKTIEDRDEMDLGEDVKDDNPVWDKVTHYVAALCANLVLLVSPEKIVLGGGIMQRKALFPTIRKKCISMLNAYVDVPEVTNETACESFIVPGSKHAGLVGAFYLAQVAHDENHKGQRGRL